MKKRHIVKTALVLAVVLGLAARASAFLGFGDLVFDPAVYAQMVEQLVRMEQQYDQLVRSYAMLNNQYTHMVQMARQVPVDMATRYRAIPSRWQPFAATDSY